MRFSSFSTLWGPDNESSCFLTENRKKKLGMCLTVQMQAASLPDLSLCSRQMGALLLVFTVMFVLRFCEESLYLETPNPVFCMAVYYENLMIH